MNLPDASITAAQLLVGAVRDHDAERVAEIVAGADLPALVVTLAAMVDDSRTVKQLLAWNDKDCGEDGEGWDRMVWRRNLTEEQCKALHADFVRGERGPDVEDGQREYQRRRKLIQHKRRKGLAA